MRLTCVFLIFVWATSVWAELDPNYIPPPTKTREEIKKELLKKPVFKNNTLEGTERQERGARLPRLVKPGQEPKAPTEEVGPEAVTEEAAQEATIEATESVAGKEGSPEQARVKEPSKDRKPAQKESEEGFVAQAKENWVTVLIAVLAGFFFLGYLWRKRQA